MRLHNDLDVWLLACFNAVSSRLCYCLLLDKVGKMWNLKPNKAFLKKCYYAWKVLFRLARCWEKVGWKNACKTMPYLSAGALINELYMLIKMFFNRAKQQTLIVDKSQPSPADIKGSVCRQSSKEKVYQLSFKQAIFSVIISPSIFAEITS